MMKAICFVIPVFLSVWIISFQTSYGQQWNYFNSGSTEDLVAIDFTARDSGFIVNSSLNELLSTTNGLTWVDTSINFSYLGKQSKDILFTTSDFGYIPAGSDFGTGIPPKEES